VPARSGIRHQRSRRLTRRRSPSEEHTRDSSTTSMLLLGLKFWVVVFVCGLFLERYCSFFENHWVEDFLSRSDSFSFLQAFLQRRRWHGQEEGTQLPDEVNSLCEIRMMLFVQP